MGIDGLLKREASGVDSDSDCDGERNLALLRGGIGAAKGWKAEGDGEDEMKTARHAH